MTVHSTKTTSATYVAMTHPRPMARRPARVEPRDRPRVRTAACAATAIGLLLPHHALSEEEDENQVERHHRHGDRRIRPKLVARDGGEVRQQRQGGGGVVR